MNLLSLRSIYFIGIGGISMQGLADYFRSLGAAVHGSDLATTGHSKENVVNARPWPDLIITSAAITPRSPGWVEVMVAKEQGIPVKDRAWLIGELMRQPNAYGVAIAGSHGKSTTTAMLGKILVDAGCDPLILCGAVMPEYGGSVRIPDKQSTVYSLQSTVGKPFYIIAEACEYERQFLKFAPKAIIVTNVDKEHLDTYPKGLPQIIRAYRDFIKLVPSNGLAIVNGDDRNVQAVAKSARCKVKFFTLKKLWPGLSLAIPGDFNCANATAAAHLAHELGVKHVAIKKSLNRYQGISRRLEYKGTFHGAAIYDDYGHHPTEIKATLKALRSQNKEKKIILVFQPHQFLRTHHLLDEFKKSFQEADMLILAPIYEVAGRDSPGLINNEQFYNAIDHANKELFEDESYQSVVKHLKNLITNNSVVLTMGATPIYSVADQLAQENT